MKGFLLLVLATVAFATVHDRSFPEFTSAIPIPTGWIVVPNADHTKAQVTLQLALSHTARQIKDLQSFFDQVCLLLRFVLWLCALLCEWVMSCRCVVGCVAIE